MLKRFSVLLLFPLLILQGIFVRLTVPRLPEATGPRSGKHGRGSAINLLVLGDSAAAGVGVETQQQALSGQLADQLSDTYQLNWQLKAQTGLKTREVLAMLDNMTETTFDVVICSVGVNDITGQTRVNTWLSHLDQLTQQLQNKFSAQTIILTAVPPMDKFPALPQPLRWYMGNRAQMFNQQLHTYCQKKPNCIMLKPDFDVSQAFIARDGFHPNERAYEVWAEQVKDLLAQN